MKFKIATWNVNSLRVRLPHVLAWLAAHQPDILALQEIKLVDPDFPLAAIQEAGYHAVFAGQKTYNGVAFLSRQPSREIITDMPHFQDPQRRILGATFGDVRILNIYVPNGESLVSEKYRYKLNWLENLRSFLQKELLIYPKMIVLGDFNIAPEAEDVHNPESWEGQVLVSDQERAAFQAILNLGFTDCFRLYSKEKNSFSWWDYRLNAFKRNLGARIDHILASNALSTQCVGCHIDKTPRSLERPSDHAPVMADFFDGTGLDSNFGLGYDVHPVLTQEELKREVY